MLVGEDGVRFGIREESGCRLGGGWWGYIREGAGDGK